MKKIHYCYILTVHTPFNGRSFFHQLSLDRGFMIAHIRGEDLGRKWYEDGKLLKKEKYFHRFY
jgi:protease II